MRGTTCTMDSRDLCCGQSESSIIDTRWSRTAQLPKIKADPLYVLARVTQYHQGLVNRESSISGCLAV
jgi:hypothetical protein